MQSQLLPSEVVRSFPAGSPSVDADLLRCIGRIGRNLRETGISHLADPRLELYAKLEFENPIGSIKDRPAYWILRKAIERGEIRAGTTVIESSSGNFASALAAYCKLIGLEFIPVIDPNISPVYESTLRRLCRRVVKVVERDDTGGFLKTRLQTVQELLHATPGSFWPNQYANPDALDAHYWLTAGEICRQMPFLDYIFLGVSTGGTISGVSRRVKEAFPGVRVVAVDAEGSVIFGGNPKKRFIPGIGASVRTELASRALVDDVVLVSEADTVMACRELHEQHGLLVGGSSGSSYAAVRSYFSVRELDRMPVVLFLCADRGTAYLDTIFDRDWVSQRIAVDGRTML